MRNQSGRCGQVFRALADPTRRQIVERLIRSPASVGELAEPLARSRPAVLQHLGVLEGCDVVRSEKVGRVRTGQRAPDGFGIAGGGIGRHQTGWEERLDAQPARERFVPVDRDSGSAHRTRPEGDPG